MANELAVVNDNWLELADSGKPLPRPFEREILLFGSHLAEGSQGVEYAEKNEGLADGTELKLVITGDKKGDQSLVVWSKGGIRLGLISKRWSPMLIRLMKAGKAIVCRYRGNCVVEDEWLDIQVDIYLRDV